MSETKRRRRAYKPSEQETAPEVNQDLVNLVSQALVTAAAQKKNTQGRPVARQNEQDSDTIDLVALFWRIMSKIHYVIIAAIVGVLIGGLYAYVFYVPTYSATAKLYILSNKDSVINLSDLQLGNALGPDYSEVFKTWEVSEMVRTQMNVDYSYGQLQGMLSVTIPNNSRVLYLTVRSKNPQEAADVANAFANAGKKFIMETMGSEEPNTFSFALVPGSPSTRGKSYYIMMGFALGTMLALGIIVLMFLLDKRPRSAEDVSRASGLPVLTVIPMEKGMDDTKKRSRKHERGQ